jgi:hypothetical protein
MINNTNDPNAKYSDDFTTWFTINSTNIKDNEFTANHSYLNNDDWNFKRQYWGRNISDVINEALTAGTYSGQNYTARFFAADGYSEPVAKGKFGPREPIPFNITEIEEGVDPAFRGDQVNDPPELVPESDLLMCLCYAQRELGEFFGNEQDPVWPSKKVNNYHTGPFNIVVPGRTRDHYLKYVTEIRVVVFPGEIPSGYSDVQ